MSDAQKLRIGFGKPQDGWLTVTLSQGDTDYRFFPSHVPYDSISEVAQALLKMLDGYEEAVARWNDEPVEYEFRFNREGKQLRLTVSQINESAVAGRVRQEVFTSRGSVHDIVRACWKALRDLESRQSLDEYERQWREPFPEREVTEVSRRLKALK